MNPWKYTPRQMYFWLDLIGKEKRREEARMLKLNAMAAQGTGKEINEQSKALEKD